MGVCCVKEDDLPRPAAGTQNQEAKPAKAMGSMSTSRGDSIGEDPAVKAALEKQRRLTHEERKAQAEHFLSFKNNRSFKQVANFREHYIVKKDIGSGAFGSVHLGEHRKSGVPCAIKIIRKSSLKVARVYGELNKNELQVLEETTHPHITRVFELMEDSRCYYIIMELISGGNLFDRIKKMRSFSEDQSMAVMKQLSLALNYMHGLNIMHRDLKPENLLCEQQDDGQIIIKLTDFGFATHFDPDKPETLSLGSPLYMAPELCNELRYDNKVDVWAVGVITYVMLTGCAPFAGKDKATIYKAVTKMEPDYRRLANASSSTIAMIKACLQKDPDQRPTMSELLQMEAFASMSNVGSLDDDKKLNISANLAAYTKTTTFQSGICSIIANLQTKAEELNDVREMFLRFDANNDGFITLDELEAGYAELAQIFNMDEPDLRNLLKSADSNGDGRIDYPEFIAAAYQKDLLLSQDNLKRAFALLDRDGNGTVTAEELAEVFGSGHVSQRGEEVWQEIIKELDRNNDGEISFEEFSVGMQSVLRQKATFATDAMRK